MRPRAPPRGPPTSGTPEYLAGRAALPTRRALAAAVRRLLDAKLPLQGASDHGVSESVYLADPDGNGLELYRDRAAEQWPRTAAGDIAMRTEPLDLAGLLREAGA